MTLGPYRKNDNSSQKYFSDVAQNLLLRLSRVTTTGSRQWQRQPLWSETLLVNGWEQATGGGQPPRILLCTSPALTCFQHEIYNQREADRKNGPGVPPSAVNLPVRLGRGYPMIHFRECGATVNVSVKSMYSCSHCNPSSVSHWLLFIKYEKENKTACI